jgi:hypothetical protein
MPSRVTTLAFERCEDRTLATLVFVFNGNGFGAAKPDALTANAARVLQRAGNQVVQLSNPVLGTPAAFFGLARQIASISRGRPIGIVGFSAGGTLAARLAGIPALHVTAALDYYGPPDLQDFLALHRGDRFDRFVATHAHFNAAGIALLSGPSDTAAHVVAAFGLDDVNVVATDSAASFQRDFPGGQVYEYPGPHGVSILASPPALEDFLAHL